MSPRHAVQRLRVILLAAGLGTAAACASSSPIDEPEPEPPVGWRVGAAEHLDLWYHGLAQAYAANDELDERDDVVPHFDPAYADSIIALKERRGVYPTPLDERAQEFGRTFQDEVYQGLEFVPLYFRSTEALFSGIELWASVRGNPQRASTLEAARIVAFLSDLFPRASHREVLAEWVDVLREEAAVFYDEHRAADQLERQARIAEVQREWGRLAPALETYLDYLQIPDGELFLTPALGAEGRIVTSRVAAPRAIVGVPLARRPEPAVLAFVHELLYPLVGEAIEEFVSPARIRELGEEQLSTRAAVRGGAVLLEEVAPARTEAYRRLYLEATGVEPPDGVDAQERAFESAFPLPEDLERGLEDFVRQALAGI